MIQKSGPQLQGRSVLTKCQFGNRPRGPCPGTEGRTLGLDGQGSESEFCFSHQLSGDHREGTQRWLCVGASQSGRTPEMRAWVQGVCLGEGLGGTRQGGRKYNDGSCGEALVGTTPGPSPLAGRSSMPRPHSELALGLLPPLTSPPQLLFLGVLPQINCLHPTPCLGVSCVREVTKEDGSRAGI